MCNKNLLKMGEKLKVLTVQGVCKELKISRSHFETKVRDRLTQLNNGGRGVKRFFLYDEVMNLKKDGVFSNSKYNVIA